MSKGIMAIDENAGISKGQSMPWSKKPYTFQISESYSSYNK